MSMLAQQTLADWQAYSKDNSSPDEHYQSMVLQAFIILLLNPWIDDDQIGRRYMQGALTNALKWPDSPVMCCVNATYVFSLWQAMQHIVLLLPRY